MNERIRELVKQATTIEEHKWGVSYDNFNKEKFAELLFNEVANTAVVSDGMFNGNERRLYVELRLGDMVKKISVLGFEE